MADILVVDDEQYMRDLLRDLLEDAGHTVETASDGAQADALLQNWTPELIITDILMPNKGGLKLIADVRARGCDTPILAISGGGKDRKLRFLKTAETYPGVTGLDKPFGSRELVSMVAGLLP